MYRNIKEKEKEKEKEKLKLKKYIKYKIRK